MLFKKIFILIFIIIKISLISFSECLVLSNGKVLNGELLFINKNNIILKVNDKLLKFSYTLIDYFINNNSQDKELILNIEKNNGIKEIVHLIKLTKNAIFYKNFKNDQIDLILMDDIKYISLESSPNINKKKLIEKYKINYNDDINIEISFLIQLIIEKNKSINNSINDKKVKTDNTYLNIFLNYNEFDFYEKFWKKINNYLNNDTKNLLWNLYELYSNKEKYLNIINNNTDPDKANEFNDKIIKLRKEFYNRAKKIIYNTEILINYNKDENDF